MLKVRLALVVLLVCLATSARAQSVPNGTIAQGQVWTVAQWIAAWETKADTSNGSLSSPTISGGSINGSTIGGTTPAAGSFTSLSSSTVATLLQETLIGGAAGALWATNGTSGASTEGLYEHIITASGTMTDSGWSPLNSMIVGHDSRVNSSGISNLLYLDLQLGPQSQGTKHTFDVEIFANTLTADKANGLPSPFFNGFRTDAWGTVNEGGTGTGATTSYGDLFAGNTEATLTGSATDWHGITSFEADVSVCAACSVSTKIGMSVVLSGADATQGALFDAGYSLGAQNGVADGWKNGFAVGNPSHQWPLSSDGTLIAAYRGSNDSPNPATAAWGIDLLQTTFGSGLLRGVNFSISGLGTVVVGAGQIAPSTNGLSISAPGFAVSSSAISAGGTGYTAAGGVVRDDYGDEWTISGVSAGAVTGITPVATGYYVGSAPTNPVPTYCVSGNCGNDNLTVNLTWTVASLVMVTGLQVPTLTVAALPVCSSTAKGEIYAVSDASSPTYNASLTGGSSTWSLAACNGSAWTAH